MRVTFLGKGGSGKTTLATLFVFFLKNRFNKIIAIDADLNDHFGQYLGFASKPPRLADAYLLIKNYVFKNYPFKVLPPIGTIPPRKECRFFFIDKTNPVLEKFALKKNNLYYLNVGIYCQHEIGNACFHGKLNSLELFLNYTLDKKNELMVIDAMAGTEYLATSLYATSDLYFFIIEPEITSINVYKQYLRILGEKKKQFNLKIVPIFNKITKDKEIDLILSKLPEIKKNQAIYFEFEKKLRLFEQGQKLVIKDILKKFYQPLKKLENLASSVKRDLNKYLNNWIEIFKNECRVWVNNKFQRNFEELIDEKFSFETLKRNYV